MENLNKKAWGGLSFLIAAVGLLLFLTGGTIYYWQAWVYLAILSISVSAITFYLMRENPELLKRRVNAGPAAEKEKSQKTIQFIAQFSFAAFFLASALDHRFFWSRVPIYIVVTGDALVVLGFFIVFLVFKENSFTSATVEVYKKQKVISSGLYGMVRHPMYSGALLMLLATPLALGSWFGLLAFIPMAFIIVLRLLDEERYLSKNLTGYKKYCEKVPWRLVPGVF